MSLYKRYRAYGRASLTDSAYVRASEGAPPKPRVVARPQKQARPKCQSCDGWGGHYWGYSWKTCRACRGTGLTPKKQEQE